MITATIKGVTKVMHQETGKYFLDVRFTLKNGDDVMNEEVSLGFPLDTAPEDIQAELMKYCATIESDGVVAEQNKAFEEANAKADETIAVLMGAAEPKAEEAVTPSEEITSN